MTESSEELRRQLDQARSDLKAMASLAGHRAAGVASGAKAAVADQAAQLSDEARALLADARSKGEQGLEELSERVRERPVASVGMAFVAGFVFAVLFGRR